jgi:hypothetical protein
MTEIINNAFYLGIGVLIGLTLGWTLSSMRYSKQVRDALTKDEHGWYRHTLSLSLVILFTATAAIWTGIVNSQQHHSRICTERAFSALLSALDERTSLSTDLSIADSEQNKAFSKFIGALLSKPQPSKNQMRLLFIDYQTKLNTYLDLQDNQRDTQLTNPFPKDAHYKECLEGK